MHLAFGFDSCFTLLICVDCFDAMILIILQHSHNKTEEPYYETDYEKKKFSHDFCSELAQHLIHLKNLPVQCKKYTDVVTDLKKRDVDDTHGTADLS